MIITVISAHSDYYLTTDGEALDCNLSCQTGVKTKTKYRRQYFECLSSKHSPRLF